MQKFTVLAGVAAPLPMVNVDTDKIIPKQFLKTVKRTGLAEGLFYDLRHDEAGHKQDTFILDREPYDRAKILVTGENFGCGSSREHAPWALLDFGISCIVAPSFADIFYNNCFKNGILPISLPKAQVDVLMADAKDRENPNLTVDLVSQEVLRPNGAKVVFEIDPFLRQCLLDGLDDIGITLSRNDKITAFEEGRRAKSSWLDCIPA